MLKRHKNFDNKLHKISVTNLIGFYRIFALYPVRYMIFFFIKCYRESFCCVEHSVQLKIVRINTIWIKFLCSELIALSHIIRSSTHIEKQRMRKSVCMWKRIYRNVKYAVISMITAEFQVERIDSSLIRNILAVSLLSFSPFLFGCRFLCVYAYVSATSASIWCRVGDM